MAVQEAPGPDHPVEEQLGAFRHVPFMGVIFVVHEAMKRGFVNGHPDWSNLGQGQPEVGLIDGAPARVDAVSIEPEDHAYGPLEGTPELREAIAAHYNRLYRQDRVSKYSAANVAVAHGGRLSLTRAMAALGERVAVGYQNPDYTAYEDMFRVHLARLRAVPVEALPEDGFTVPAERLGQHIREHDLNAYILSNPCNPTGSLLEGEDLRAVVDLSRQRETTLLFDEFYSHFIYTAAGAPGSGPVSAARYVDDVDSDPVIVFDGLTKSFRYPGWRLGWALGPPAMVESMARTASSIDGGPSRIVQRAALDALSPAQADQETEAVRQVFANKRNVMLERLENMGVRFAHAPRGTFYCWGSLEGLAEPFNDAMAFFWRALDRKVMTVPGQFFDIDPGKTRTEPSQFSNWMRFSFGPPLDNVEMGLGRLAEMLA